MSGKDKNVTSTSPGGGNSAEGNGRDEQGRRTSYNEPMQVPPASTGRNQDPTGKVEPGRK